MAQDPEQKDEDGGPPAAADALSDPRGESADDARPKGSDVVVIHGRTTDGSGLGVSRLREGRVEVGVVQPLREGKPIAGEVVRLSPRPECPIVCDVEVDVSREQIERATAPAPREPSCRSSGITRTLERHGPAQVATDEYRRNWDVIWAGRKKASQPS